MKEFPTLKNAPITEALIDIRVKLPSVVDANKIDSIYESIKKQYPERQEQKISKLKFEPKAEGAVQSSGAKINGYRYINSDKTQIVQMRLDGFTFNRLKPYETWENFRDEAHRLWKMYFKIVSPESIYRVAVRYINNLNIPMPLRDFEDYLTAPPVVPKELPQEISSFLNRIVIPEPSIKAFAIITQALEGIIDSGKFLPVILDIDVFKNEPNGMNEDEIWDALENLRHLKNKIFFYSITNQLKETYE